jgi:hypothetical protein
MLDAEKEVERYVAQELNTDIEDSLFLKEFGLVEQCSITHWSLESC